MAKKRTFERLVILADLHCGHRTGLTPPAWQLRPSEDAEPKRMKWVNIQQEHWAWFAREISRLKPIDHCIVNGDCIDGTGSRSGGTELITTDRNTQIDMCLKCLRHVGARDYVIIRGTPYHTGEIEDLEDIIAGQLQCKIGDHDSIGVNGTTFDCKHWIGGSYVPHGRITAIEREKLWGAIWTDRGERPWADWVIRSHVHYCCGSFHLAGHNGRKRLQWGMTTPALQAMGTRYGARRCSGTVDFGFVRFDVRKDEPCLPYIHYLDPETTKAMVTQL